MIDTRPPDCPDCGGAMAEHSPRPSPFPKGHPFYSESTALHICLDCLAEWEQQRSGAWTSIRWGIGNPSGRLRALPSIQLDVDLTFSGWRLPVQLEVARIVEALTKVFPEYIHHTIGAREITVRLQACKDISLESVQRRTDVARRRIAGILAEKGNR